MREADRAESGAALIEFALTLPLFLAFVCIVLDFGLVSLRQTLVTEAAYRAARRAVVAAPVVKDAILHWETAAALDAMGTSCANSVVCPTVDLTCDGRSNDPCTDTPEFAALVSETQKLVASIDRNHLSVSYRSIGLGFVGRPGGVPLLVTIRISCIPAQSIILRRFMPGQSESGAGCDPKDTSTGVLAASATLVSESLSSN